MALTPSFVMVRCLTMDGSRSGSRPAGAGLVASPDYLKNARDTPDHRRSGAAPWNYLFQSRRIGLALPAVGPLVGSAGPARSCGSTTESSCARRGRGRFWGRRFAGDVRFLLRFTGFRKNCDCWMSAQKQSPATVFIAYPHARRVSAKGAGADCATYEPLSGHRRIGTDRSGLAVGKASAMTFVREPDRRFAIVPIATDALGKWLNLQITLSQETALVMPGVEGFRVPPFSTIQGPKGLLLQSPCIRRVLSGVTQLVHQKDEYPCPRRTACDAVPANAGRRRGNLPIQAFPVRLPAACRANRASSEPRQPASCL